ncbi:hypothetical protein L6164_009566 [Bauhinia variegata]|uniref:Uncharacterized protein n=1 Tax=Bauhinia variegata TaxID=167791 RepID=A0ACB9PK51_BAUVA|nr:hypothetical protein L6164_009566 [Bauhinia variegata]
MDSEHAICKTLNIIDISDYCLSNDYINSIITHPNEFDGGDLAPYLNFCIFSLSVKLYAPPAGKVISCKVDRDTLCLLVKVQRATVVWRLPHWGPYFSTSSISSAHYVNLVEDDIRREFHGSHLEKFSEYLYVLVHRSSDLCFHLDSVLHPKGYGRWTLKKGKNTLTLESENVVDRLYYFEVILSIGECCLSRLVTENILNGLVFSILLLLSSKKNNASYDQYYERFRKELDRIWFDYIPDTLRNEWENSKRVLQESSPRKDPLFMLELVIHQNSPLMKSSAENILTPLLQNDYLGLTESRGDKAMMMNDCRCTRFQCVAAYNCATRISSVCITSYVSSIYHVKSREHVMNKQCYTPDCSVCRTFSRYQKTRSV